MSDLSITSNSTAQNQSLLDNNLNNDGFTGNTKSSDSLYKSQFSTEQAYNSVKGSWFAGVKQAASMFTDWALGRGDADRTYKPGSVQVDMLKDSLKVNQARQYFIDKNKDVPLQYQKSVTNYAASFGLKGLLRSGVDPMEQYVGSFDIQIDSKSDGTVQFKLDNTTSMKSLLYGAFFSWERGSFKPGGNMRQTYTWVEQNPTIGLDK